MSRKAVVIKKHLATRAHLHVTCRLHVASGVAAQRVLLEVDISHVNVCVYGCADRPILLELRTPIYNLGIIFFRLVVIHFV